MKEYLITLSLMLHQLPALVGQNPVGCSIQSADLWTDRDYLFAGVELSGSLLIQGQQKPSITVELNLVQAETNRTIAKKYLRLDLQKGDFKLPIHPRTRGGWYWLLARHPESREILTAKKLFVITSDEDYKISDRNLLTVHPEGGKWISGKSQRFLITTQPEIETVFIFSNQNAVDTLLLKDGTVTGAITFEDGQDYSLRYLLEKDTVKVPLTTTHRPTLLIDEIDENIEINLGGRIQKPYQIVIKSRVDSISYEANNLPIVLPKRFLPKGLKHIGLYESGKLIGFQWYYIQPNPVFTIDISDQREAVTSDSILLEVAVKDHAGHSLPSALIEHAFYPYFQSTDNGLLHDFNLLTSHNRRVAISKAENEKEINGLLIGAEFIQNSFVSLSNECLPEGITVKGRLTTAVKNGQSLVLATPGTLPGLHYTNTFSSEFSFPPILENNENYAYITGKPPVNKEIVSNKESGSNATLNLLGTERPNKRIIDHLRQLDLIEKNFKGFKRTKNSPEVAETLKTYYRKADYRISIDDFVYLEQMSVVIKEIIPYVFFKKKKIMIFSEEQRKTFPGRPLLMIDGIPVSSDSSVLELEPAEIDRIDVLNKRNSLLPLGYLAQNGVMAIYTKAGDYIPDEAIRIDLPTYVSKSKNELLVQERGTTGSLDLADVTKWWSSDYTGGQSLFKAYPTLDLGNQYEILVGAFHPRLGLQFRRKEISIKYENVK
ncbi:MAG: hypothetical protein ACO2ZZ_04390 [Cyclobacteriaceae bacterium]